MRARSALVFAIALALALVLPLSALATPEPQEDRDETPRVQRTPPPDASPVPTLEPAGDQFAITPDRVRLSVGFAGASLIRQAPLLLARQAGYFDDAGFESVTVSAITDVAPGIRSGDLDIAVVGVEEAAALHDRDPSLRAIAGFRNYPRGTYGGDLLLAAPGLVDEEPATIVAFLVAYIRALQDLAGPEVAAEALALIDERTDLAIGEDLVAAWPDAVAVYAPFDGGFGSVEEDSGYGELAAYLEASGGPVPTLDAFIGQPTLNAAQAWSELAPNPTNMLTGPPGVEYLVVGMPDPDTSASPIVDALDAGYLAEAGFGTVEIVDVDEPLLGVLQGHIDIGVMDAVDVAEAIAQGLPLVALAGHRNYGGDGSYGGDMLVASTDLLGEEGSSVTAFLAAYVRALRESADDAAFAPRDGGFGDPGIDGGLGELRAYLSGATGAEPDLDTMIDARPLEYAQAHWGLRANPGAEDV